MNPNDAIRLYFVLDCRLGPKTARDGTYLHHQFDIVGDLISGIQLPVGTWFVADHQHPEDLLLVDSHAPRKLGKPLIGFVACLIDNADIEVVFLVLKQGCTEVPILLGGYIQDRRPSFVRQSRRWMPGLNVLTEDHLQLGRILLLDHRLD